MSAIFIASYAETSENFLFISFFLTHDNKNFSYRLIQFQKKKLFT